MREPPWMSATIDLIASFGRPLPSCPNCGCRMVMSCRETIKAAKFVFTFECRSCRWVMRREKKNRLKRSQSDCTAIARNSPQPR